jgi:hypothetical protein
MGLGTPLQTSLRRNTPGVGRHALGVPAEWATAASDGMGWLPPAS